MIVSDGIIAAGVGILLAIIFIWFGDILTPDEEGEYL